MSGPTVVALLDRDQADPAPEGAPGVSVHPVSALDELLEVLPAAQAAVMWEYRADLLEPAWEKATRLEWLHVAGAGVDGALFPALVESRVTVTNAGGVFDSPVAEYAVTLLLALARDVVRTARLQAGAVWDRRPTRSLAGTHLVIVGAGSIGSAVARLARALGMSVVGIARAARDDPDYDAVLSAADLGRSLAHAHHVVVTLPLTAETEKLMDAEALGSLRPGATLVNVGRGAVIDETALLAALNEGRLAGAALDVFAREPLPPEHPLWHHPRVIVSPHMAANVDGVYDALVAQWRVNVARWLGGEPLLSVIEKQLYGP